jgi:hypothetical protein
MAHKALKPPIEPLSEQACQRLEDAVINRLRWQQPEPTPSRQPRLALLLAAASLSISALAVATATDFLSPGELPGAHPTRSAEDRAASVASAPAHDARSVRIGVTESEDEQPEDQPVITTGSESSTFALGSSELIVAPRSRVQYRGSDADGWVVVVETGRVACEVAPRRGRPDFVVHAGTVEVRVVGTRFDVAYHEGQASVSVDEGKVLVFDSGQQTVLLSGQTWPTRDSSDASSDEQSNDVARRRASSTAAREDYELAARLESSEPARALSIYRTLSNSRGPWAANALYAQARLLKEGGRDGEAKKLLSRYLKLYPRGANAADARRLLGAPTP